MDQRSYSTGSAPEIRIESIGGNLEVRGWDLHEVQVQTGDEALQVHELEDELHVSSHSDCSLKVPSGAVISVQRVHGNARLRSLEDRLAIEEVRGNLDLRGVAETSIGSVRGDLTARLVTGELRADSVGGNAAVRNIQGSLTLDKVGGNFDMRGLENDLHAIVEGNARIRLGLISGSRYELEAAGNVYCRFDEPADLELEITSGGQNIKIDLPGRKESVRSGEHAFTLGSGAAVMRISAGGMVFVSGKALEVFNLEDALGDDASEIPDDFGERLSRQIESHVEAQIEMINRQIEGQIEGVLESLERSGLSPEQRERILERTRLSGERAASRAQEKVRRAQERIERKMENMRKRSQRGREFQGGAASHTAAGQESARQAATEEERLMILRMLEQKKITLQEAEQLLEALEGRGQ